MNKTQIENIISELIDFIVSESTKNQYGLSMTHFFWPEEKKWSPRITEFDDIGDYLTFISWAGKILNKPKLDLFVEDQMKKWIDYGKLPSGWFLDQINLDKNLPNKSLKLSISVYGLQDAILGFYELYKLTNNKIYLNQLIELLKKVNKVSEKYDGRLPNQIINYLDVSTPITSASPVVAGLIAEHAYLMHKDLKNEALDKLGDQIINGWLKTNLWQRHNLFHQGYNSYISSFSIYKETKIMKENSNMIYAMLMKPEKYQNEISQLTSKILEFQHTSGAFYGKWSISEKKIITDGFEKVQNFTVIDLLIDIASKTKIQSKSKLINTAMKCADFWIKVKDQKTQLIPDYISSKGKPKYFISKLDQSADLYSSFLRLYSLTGKRKYLTEAEVGAVVMKNYFGQKKWWFRIVNTKTGKPAKDEEVPNNDKPAGRNLTKYVGGALRFYLSLYEVRSGKSMQKDKLLWLLSRDR